jgi:hypothetical protein
MGIAILFLAAVVIAGLQILESDAGRELICRDLAILGHVLHPLHEALAGFRRHYNLVVTRHVSEERPIGRPRLVLQVTVQILAFGFAIYTGEFWPVVAALTFTAVDLVWTHLGQGIPGWSTALLGTVIDGLYLWTIWPTASWIGENPWLFTGRLTLGVAVGAGILAGNWWLGYRAGARVVS